MVSWTVFCMKYHFLVWYPGWFLDGNIIQNVLIKIKEKNLQVAPCFRTGSAIITWNNPKKLEKPYITQGQYVSIFRGWLSHVTRCLWWTPMLWRSFLNISFLKLTVRHLQRAGIVSGRVSSNSPNPYRWPSRWLTGATRPYKWSYNLITSVFGPTLYGVSNFSPGFPDIITPEFGVQLHQLGIGGQRCWTEIRRQFATPREPTVSACGCSRLGWVIFNTPPKLGERFFPFLGGTTFSAYFQGRRCEVFGDW